MVVDLVDVIGMEEFKTPFFLPNLGSQSWKAKNFALKAHRTESPRPAPHPKPVVKLNKTIGGSGGHAVNATPVFLLIANNQERRRGDAGFDERPKDC